MSPTTPVSPESPSSVAARGPASADRLAFLLALAAALVVKAGLLPAVPW